MYGISLQNGMTMQTEQIVLGGGCFWCIEAAYQLIEGVATVVPGYSGGDTKEPTYREVCSGTTGHAEVVRVEFDPSVISLEKILEIFWTIHDPTTLNRQGADIGTQYRSILRAKDEEQLRAAEKSRDAAAALWDAPIVTDIGLLRHFYPAEEEHHNYFRKHPTAGYCQVVINPKLAKMQQQYGELLKDATSF